MGRHTWLQWVSLALLCQAMCVPALPAGCTSSGTVLVSCAGWSSGNRLNLSSQGLTAITAGAFDGLGHVDIVFVSQNFLDWECAAAALTVTVLQIVEQQLHHHATDRHLRPNDGDGVLVR